MLRKLITAGLVASALTLAGCGAQDRAPAGGTSNANAATTTNAGASSANTTQGAGPHNTGIGGTSPANRDSPAANSNVEPTGVNKNAGRGGANANRP